MLKMMLHEAPLGGRFPAAALTTYGSTSVVVDSWTQDILVGGFNPSEKYESVGMMTFPIYGKIYGKIKNVWNHQPVSKMPHQISGAEPRTHCTPNIRGSAHWWWHFRAGFEVYPPGIDFDSGLKMGDTLEWHNLCRENHLNTIKNWNQMFLWMRGFFWKKPKGIQPSVVAAA